MFVSGQNAVTARELRRPLGRLFQQSEAVILGVRVLHASLHVHCGLWRHKLQDVAGTLLHGVFLVRRIGELDTANQKQLDHGLCVVLTCQVF